MNSKTYDTIEKYMLEKMDDSAHDPLHIYRVLYMAAEIAETENNVNNDILIAACLLHDIGRGKQFENLEKFDHAEIGAEMAADFLTKLGWSENDAKHVGSAIRTHRYRKGRIPESIEAKILFDADKLDSAGAMGIARTILYSGRIGERLYIMENGEPLTTPVDAEISSFFQEYNYKLRNIYDAFYTEYAKKAAAKRKEIASLFYESLFDEVKSVHENGRSSLLKMIV